MKNNVFWLCAVLMMAFGMSSCSSDDDDDNPIVGTWELKTLGFPGVDIEIPSRKWEGKSHQKIQNRF